MSQNRTKPNDRFKYMKSSKSESVLSNKVHQKAKDQLLQSFRTTVAELGFTRHSGHDANAKLGKYTRINQNIFK